jgi:hypothetical protein
MAGTVAPVAPQRREVPTHLHVEDRAFHGLSLRQVGSLLVGGVGAYGLWTQWPDAAPAPRLVLAAACLAVAAAFALVRPHGRPLDDWAFAALHYAVVPKASVWCVREPAPTTWRAPAAGWAPHAPRLRWKPAPAPTGTSDTSDTSDVSDVEAYR